MYSTTNDQRQTGTHANLVEGPRPFGAATLQIYTNIRKDRNGVNSGRGARVRKTVYPFHGTQTRRQAVQHETLTLGVCF